MIKNQYNQIPHPASDTKFDTKFVLQTMNVLQRLHYYYFYRLQKRISICNVYIGIEFNAK